MQNQICCHPLHLSRQERCLRRLVILEMNQPVRPLQQLLYPLLRLPTPPLTPLQSRPLCTRLWDILSPFNLTRLPLQV